MYPVGDGIDLILRKHLLGDLAMLFCYTVCVAAEVQGQQGHVEVGFTAELLYYLKGYIVDQPYAFVGSSPFPSAHYLLCKFL